MKCMNCGKNDVNFYYTSNINGKVTKQQLCTECAEKLGYMQKAGSLFSGRDMSFGGMLDRLFDRSFSPFANFGLGARDFMSLPWFEEPTAEAQCKCDGGCCGEKNQTVNEEADAELSRRREINALRYQMRTAAENEDFEKAAELRDRIKKLESEE